MNKCVALSMVLLVAASVMINGCGKKEQPQAQQPQQTQQQHQQQHQQMNHTMEDPVPVINQMNQTISDVDTKAKANQWTQAKLSAGNLASLNQRLYPHFSDTAFRDKLQRSIAALHEEVSKATPDQSAVTSQIQNIQTMLKEAPNKMMAM